MQKSILVAGLTLVCAASNGSAQTTGAIVREWLPTGRVAVEVMEQHAPPRLAELTQKFQAAVAKNPGWFQEHVRQTPDGEPIAYDARTGLTEAEFQEFLVLPESIRMLPTRVDTVVIVKTRNGWR